MFNTWSKRHVLLGAGIMATASVLALTGCGRGATTEPAPALDDSAATGTVEFWYGGGSPEAVTEISDDFEAENPGVTVNVTHIPEANLDSKVLTAITSGKVPDLVHLVSYTEESMLSTGGFAPMPKGLVDPDAYFPNTFEPGVVDGVAYAVPWDVTTAVFQYRKDLADAAGVDAPKTWEEFVQFSKALQGAGAKYGFALNVGYDQYAAADFLNFVQQNGGNFTNDDETEWTINAPENVEALEFTWGNLIADGIASPDGPLFLDTVPWFSSGDVGAIVMGPWFESWLDEANSPEWTATHLATAPVPAGPGGSISGLSGDVLTVPEGAANSDAAWRFVKYLARPDVQVKLYEKSGLLPAVEAAWDEPAIANHHLLDPFREALKTAMPTPRVATWNEVAPIIGQQIERVARGEATAQEALDEAQARAESIGMGEN